MMNQGETLIHAGNWHRFVTPTVDGDKKAHGLRPRDFNAAPVGCMAGAPRATRPRIPRSDWPALIKEQAAKLARCSDYRNAGNNGGQIKSRDQNGRGYCHTADTEVLTERGWTPWPEYNWTDLLGTVNTNTGAMEFQAPFEKHVYEYDGEMVYSTNGRLDFGVTPDHRMLVRKWDESKRTLSDRYTFQRAGEIGWYAGLMHAPAGWLGTDFVEIEIPGDRRYDGDDFVALLSLIVSDGFAASYEHSGDLVSFASFRPECRERVAALAARLGFREQPSRPGVWNRWGAGALAQWMFANCYTGGGFKAQHKKVPDLVKVASQRQIKLFLAWNGDQNHNRDAHGECYYSCSKRMIDDLQELCLRVGKRGSISHRESRTNMMPQGVMSTARECWELRVSKTERLCIDRKKHIETDRYRGPVYCAAVPNGTLITRRNGSMLISGNCWAHSTTSAALVGRAKDGQPYADLSAYAIACIIKNYRDEGGWNGESMKFLRERGCPTSEFWAQQSTSRSNDNPKTWENAALHKMSEWEDIDEGDFDMQATHCLLGNPHALDLNWWSHSICGCDLVDGTATFNAGGMRTETGKTMDAIEFDQIWETDTYGAAFGIRIWNSWGDSWEQAGMAVLTEGKARNNGAIALLVTGGAMK